MKLTTLIAASLSTVMLGGCGNTPGYAIDAAIKECSQHGGVHEIYDDAWQKHAICRDGTRAMNLMTTKAINP